MLLIYPPPVYNSSTQDTYINKGEADSIRSDSIFGVLKSYANTAGV